MLDLVYVLGLDTFCTSTANIWQFVGYVVFVFKIIIPLILVIFGMVDLGKAVTASKDDEIKKAAKSLGMRAVAAVIIFFIPTIVAVIFGVVGGFKGDVEDQYKVCLACVTSPTKCDISQVDK